jgi:putative two-component system hydrogenase maturation factor HypX/HoxX
MLKKLIPESVWSAHRCLIVHPGPPGDRGPSSLDWAIELGAGEWGVTVLEADRHFDAGAVWASRTFDTRPAGKSSLYRHEVRRAAVEAIVEAVQRIAEPEAAGVRVAGEDRPLMTQDVRAIDWAGDPTDAVVRKLRAAEGHPGVRDGIGATEFHLFGVHREGELRGEPGEIVATRWPARASRCGRPRSRSPSTRRCPTGTPSAKSPTRSTRVWAICTSTSTTAR